MSAVDFAYLESFVGNDPSIVREVLTLFREQAEGWSRKLEGTPPDWRDLAHTICGASRGVGANALGDLAATAERGTPDDLPAVRSELQRVLAEITAYQGAHA